jgi:KDEL-tailed cysteine endopeptidase
VDPSSIWTSGQTKKVPFDVEDLKSEQTLWALYNRWCSYFNVAGSSVDKGYRFNIFKEKVRLIYDLKGADPKNLELNHLCDVAVDELCPPKFFRRRY